MRIPRFVLPVTITVAATVAALAALTIAAPTAYASISGPCQASINGESVGGLSTGATSKAIEVEKDSQIPVTMSAASEIDHLKIQLEFAGIRWTAHDEATNGTSWAKTVNVKDYTKYGIGLYKVIGVSTGPGVNCTGEALVKVNGNPLTTAAGAGAAAVTVVGVAAVAAAGLGAISFYSETVAPLYETAFPAPRVPDFLAADSDPNRFRLSDCSTSALSAFLLTTLAMIGVIATYPVPGPGNPYGAPPPLSAWPYPPLRRKRYGLRISVIGIIGGLLAGIGAVVLLQQYGKVYPTAGVAISGIAAGLVLGIVIPTLGRMVAVNRLNRRIAVIEAWLIAQGHVRPQAPGQAGPPPQA